MDMRRILLEQADRCWDVLWAWDGRQHLPLFRQQTLDEGEWGNAFHIGVAAWAFKVTILVFTNGEPQVFGEGEWTWALKFSTNADGTGGHYDVLKVRLNKDFEGRGMGQGQEEAWCRGDHHQESAGQGNSMQGNRKGIARERCLALMKVL
jgi:hypothetical protein